MYCQILIGKSVALVNFTNKLTLKVNAVITIIIISAGFSLKVFREDV